jgi:uncharacterized protein with GYD domain
MGKLGVTFKDLNIRTTTLRAFSRDAMGNVIGKLAS